MQNNVDDELNRIQRWSLADQLKLLEGLKTIVQQQEPKKARRSILEFEGMDQESWKDINVQEYINQERNSWDG